MSDNNKIKKGCYVPTKDIPDTETFKKVIDKFVDAGFFPINGYGCDCAVDWEEDWQERYYLGVNSGGDILLHDDTYSYGSDHEEEQLLTLEDILGDDCVVEDKEEEQPLGRKFDNGKPQWRLLPWSSLKSVVEVLGFGATKYAPDNWKYVDNAKDRYSDAALRHFTAWLSGERCDSETGKSHLAHCVCCLLFLIWFDEDGDVDE